MMIDPVEMCVYLFLTMASCSNTQTSVLLQINEMNCTLLLDFQQLLKISKALFAAVDDHISFSNNLIQLKDFLLSSMSK